MKISLAICLAILNSVKSEGSGSWYSVNPSDWNQVYPACNGDSQSPINIITDDTVYDQSLDDFVFHNYNRQIQWNATFNSYSGITLMNFLLQYTVIYITHIIILVEFVPIYATSKQSVKIAVSGSNLEEKFFLTNFHFHWGPNLRGRHIIYTM